MSVGILKVKYTVIDGSEKFADFLMDDVMCDKTSHATDGSSTRD